MADMIAIRLKMAKKETIGITKPTSLQKWCLFNHLNFININ